MPPKEKHENSFNYLFVSDFHMSLGKDIRKKSINMREDFFFDEEFVRFLHWADKNRPGKDDKKKDGELWELVFVGDCFDFLPIDKYVSYIFNYFKKALPSIHTMEPENRMKILEEFFQTEIPSSLQKRLIEPYLRSDIISKEELSKLKKLPEWVDKIYKVVGPEEFEKGLIRRMLKIPGWLNQKPIRRVQRQINMQVAKAQQQINLQGAKAQQQWKGALGREKHDLFTEDSGVGKLSIIYEGHRRFFEALAWWVARGNKIVVMVGNHDLELRWPAVQEEFKNILVEIHKKAEWKNTVKKPTDFKKSLKTLVDFKHYWFYFKPGVFYAQHGSQYNNVTSVVNLMDPFWEKSGKKLLYASFGSYGDGLVSELEDYFPEWDNAKSHGPTLINKIKNYPYRVPKILLGNLALHLWFILRLFFGTRGIKKPNELEIKKYLLDTSIWSDNGFQFPQKLARSLYDSWDKPFLHHQWWSWIFYIILPFLIPIIIVLWVLLYLIFFIFLPLVRFLLSPKGFLITILALFTLFPQFTERLVQSIVDLIIGILNWINVNLGTASQRLQLIENINPFIQKNIKPVIQVGGILGAVFVLLKFYLNINKKMYNTLTSKTKKSFQLSTWGEEKYIQEAGKEAYQLFKLSVLKDKLLMKEEMPSYFIFGHDHFPFSYVLNTNDDLNDMGEIFYFNTGAWQSWFAREGHRRLRTGGVDLEFTFLRIWKPEGVGEYEADLLQWDDDAERAAEQIVFDRKEEIGLIEKTKKMFEGWILLWTGLGAMLGLIIGFFMAPWELGLVAGAMCGVLIGLGYEQWAKRKPQY